MSSPFPTSTTADSRKKTDRSQGFSASKAFNESKFQRKDSTTPSPVTLQQQADASMPTSDYTVYSKNVASSAKQAASKFTPAFVGKQQQPSSTRMSQTPSSPPQSEHFDIALRPEPINLSMSAGLWMEIGFGLSAAALLVSLWIYLMATDCYQDLDLVFWVKMFALLGAVAGIFVLIYSCFERSIAPGRGLAACLYISFLSMVGGLNLVGAYLASTCVCTCRNNPFRNGGEDLTIFVLELLGALALLAVILVASLTRPPI